MITNQEIIEAYLKTGSVWKAGKLVGLAGQTVHERLTALGYKLQGSNWTDKEITELTALANQMTIAQIANRLGRPYSGVALKISRLGLGQRFGNKQSKKIPRTGEYTKAKVKGYMLEMEASGFKITKFSRMNNLNVDSVTYALQKFYPEWYLQYCKSNAVKPETNCPYCDTLFWPLNHKQIYCNRKCANQSRTDNSYFGGKRRQTIGLLEGICQLCGGKDLPGLSSHHVKGKENDPDNDFLMALCRGCHQIVTILGGRRFVATEEAWEVLMQLVILRKNGHDPNFRGVYTTVQLDMITVENEHLYAEDTE